MLHRNDAAPLAALAASLAVCLTLGPKADVLLQKPLIGGVATRASASGPAQEPPFQRQRTTAAGYDLEFGFVNFNGDKLKVSAEISKDGLREEDRVFGYTQKDLDELKAWRDKAVKTAYDQIVARGGTQQEVDKAAADVAKEYARRRVQYMESRGFKILNGNQAAIDMTKVVAAHRRALNPLSKAFDSIATQKDYGQEELVGAVTAMVQTSVDYKIPPESDGPRHIAGLWPPLKALAYGWGDCDTKTALVASILSNWPNLKMIGVELPDHYLGAIQKTPNKGDAYIEYQGEPYVLIEAAGPAWLPPGTVSPETQNLMESSEARLEPLF